MRVPMLRAVRSLATAATPKAGVPIALISRIRTLRPGTPMSVARAALLASDNDTDAALVWLAAQTAATGAVKAAKLAGRAATEGLVGVILERDGLVVSEGGPGVRGALVEIGCETDFVARTDEFRALVEAVTRSLSFFAEAVAPPLPQLRELDLEQIKAVPLLPPLSSTSSSSYSPTNSHAAVETIGSAIATTVARLGENIALKRAVSLSIDSSAGFLASAYVHGAGKVAGPANRFQSGTLAGLLLFRLPGNAIEAEGLRTVTRALARQVVAVPTTSVLGAAAAGEGEVSTALYEQPLMTMMPSPALEFEAGATVARVLEAWSTARGVRDGGLEVLEVARWDVGGEKATFR